MGGQTVLAIPPEWVAALRPLVVISSVAAGDSDGWIAVSTDGAGMWVEKK